MTKGDKVDGKKGHIMGAKGKLEAYWLKVINQMIKRDIYKELYGKLGKLEANWLKVINQMR